MNRQTRAFGVSLCIHVIAIGVFLLAGVAAPRGRAIVLDFSLSTSANTGQTPTIARRPVTAQREQRMITPTAANEEAVPLKQEKKEDVPAPAEQQPVSTASFAPEASSSSDISARYVAAQFIYIRDKIFRNLGYPPVARKMGWAGKVVVSFTVCSDGSVENAVVVQSSGYPVLDRSAVEAIRKSCPFPRPPAKTALLMPVIYRLE